MRKRIFAWLLSVSMIANSASVTYADTVQTVNEEVSSEVQEELIESENLQTENNVIEEIEQKTEIETDELLIDDTQEDGVEITSVLEGEKDNKIDLENSTAVDQQQEELDIENLPGEQNVTVFEDDKADIEKGMDDNQEEGKQEEATSDIQEESKQEEEVTSDTQEENKQEEATSDIQEENKQTEEATSNIQEENKQTEEATSNIQEESKQAEEVTSDTQEENKQEEEATSDIQEENKQTEEATSNIQEESKQEEEITSDTQEESKQPEEEISNDKEQNRESEEKSLEYEKNEQIDKQNSENNMQKNVSNEQSKSTQDNNTLKSVDETSNEKENEKSIEQPLNILKNTEENQEYINSAQEIRIDEEITVNISEFGQVKWYKFTAEDNSSYILASDGDYDTCVTVFDEEGEYIVNDDDSGTNSNFLLKLEMQSEKTYYFCVYLYNDSIVGEFTISLIRSSTITDFRFNEESYIPDKILYGQNLYNFTDIKFDVIYNTEIETVAVAECTKYGDIVSILEDDEGYDDNGLYKLGIHEIKYIVGNKEIVTTVEVVKGSEMGFPNLQEEIYAEIGYNYGKYIGLEFIPSDSMRYKIELTNNSYIEIYNADGENIINEWGNLLTEEFDLGETYYLLLDPDESEIDQIGIKVERIPEVTGLKLSEESIIPEKILYGYNLDYSNLSFNVAYGDEIEKVFLYEETKYGDYVNDYEDGEPYDENGKYRLGEHVIKFCIDNVELAITVSVVDGSEMGFPNVSISGDYVESYCDKVYFMGFSFTPLTTQRYCLSFTEYSYVKLFNSSGEILKEEWSNEITDIFQAGEQYYIIIVPNDSTIEKIGLKVDAVPEITGFEFTDSSKIPNKILYGQSIDNDFYNIKFNVIYGNEVETVGLYENTKYGDYVYREEDGEIYDEKGKYILGLHNIRFVVSDKEIFAEVEVVEGSAMGFPEVIEGENYTQSGYNYTDRIGFVFIPSITQRYKFEMTDYAHICIYDSKGEQVDEIWSDEFSEEFNTGDTYYIIAKPENAESVGIRVSSIPTIEEFKIHDETKVYTNLIYGQNWDTILTDLKFDVTYKNETETISYYESTQYGYYVTILDDVEIYDETGKIAKGEHTIYFCLEEKRVPLDIQVYGIDELQLPVVVEGVPQMSMEKNWGNNLIFSFTPLLDTYYKFEIDNSFITIIDKDGEQIDGSYNYITAKLKKGSKYVVLCENSSENTLGAIITKIPEITSFSLDSNQQLKFIYGEDESQILDSLKFKVIYGNESELLSIGETSKYGYSINQKYIEEDPYDENGQYKKGNHNIRLCIGDQEVNFTVQVVDGQELGFPLLTSEDEYITSDVAYKDMYGVQFIPEVTGKFVFHQGDMVSDNNISYILDNDGNIYFGEQLIFEAGQSYFILCYAGGDEGCIQLSAKKIRDVESLEIATMPVVDTIIKGTYEYQLSGLSFNVKYVGMENEVVPYSELTSQGESFTYTENWDSNGNCIVTFHLGDKTADIEFKAINVSEMNMTELQEEKTDIITGNGYFKFTPDVTGKYILDSLNFSPTSIYIENGNGGLQFYSSFQYVCNLQENVTYYFKMNYHELDLVRFRHVPEIEKIELISSGKTEFYYGVEDVEFQGMIINVNYSDGSERKYEFQRGDSIQTEFGEEIQVGHSNECCEDISKYAEGKHTIKIESQESKATATMEIDVLDPNNILEMGELTEVTFTAPGESGIQWRSFVPGKSGVYAVKSTHGIEIDAMFNVESTYFNDYMYYKLTEGQRYYFKFSMPKSSFLQFGGKGNIRLIREPSVEQIEITKMPDKTEFEVFPGEKTSFRNRMLEGLVLAVKYDTGETIKYEGLDTYGNIDKYGNLISIKFPENINDGVAGKYDIVIVCGEKSVSFKITLVEGEETDDFIIETNQTIELKWNQGESYIHGIFVPEISGQYYMIEENSEIGYYIQVLTANGVLTDIDNTYFQEGKQYEIYAYNPSEQEGTVSIRFEKIPEVTSFEIVNKPEDLYYIKTVYNYNYILKDLQVKITYKGDTREYVLKYGEADKYGRYLCVEDISYADDISFTLKISLYGDENGNYDTLTGNVGTIEEYEDITQLKEGERKEVNLTDKSKIVVFKFTPQISGYYTFVTNNNTRVLEIADEGFDYHYDVDIMEAGQTYYYVVYYNDANAVDDSIFGLIKKKHYISDIEFLEFPLQTSYEYGVTPIELEENFDLLEGAKFKVFYADGTSQVLEYGQNDSYGNSWSYFLHSGSDWNVLECGEYILDITFGNVTTNCILTIENSEAVSVEVMLQDIVSNGSSFELSWNSSSTPDGYEIWRKTEEETEYSLYKTLDNSKYEDKEISSGILYSYKVRAYMEENGEKQYGNFSNVQQAMALAKVQWEDNAILRSADGIKVSWKHVSGASGYQIYRSEEKGVYSLVETVDGVEMYMDKDVKESTKYNYKISAICVCNAKIYTGAQSSEMSIDTWKQPVVNVSPSSGVTMRMNWSDLGVTGYMIYRSKMLNGPYDYVKTTTGTSTSDTNLTAGTKYYYKICGYKDIKGVRHYTLYSDIVAAVALATPVIQTVENGEKGITIMWSKASGADRYNIYRSDSPNGTYEYLQSIVSGTLYYEDETVQEGKIYYYKVRAYKRVDGIVYYGGYSDYEKAVRREGPVVTVTPSSGVTMKLSWSKLSDITAYEIYRSTLENGNYEYVKTTTGTSTSDTGRVAGTRYYYKLRAYKDEGGKKLYTAYSKPSAAVALATPIISTIENTEDGIGITWSKASGADRYNIYRSDSASGKYEYLQSIISENLYYEDNSIQEGKTYYYKVRAYKKYDGIVYYGGYSEYEKIIRHQGPNVTVVPSSGVTMKLSWNKLDNMTVYEIYRSVSENGIYEYVKATTGTSTSDTGRTAGTRYYYKVRAYKEEGNNKIYTGYSKPVAAVALAQPKLELIKLSEEGITLSWSKASGADRYNVYRSETVDGKYEYLESVLGGNTSYVDTSAQKGKEYYYKIRAYKKYDGIVYYGMYSEAMKN